MIVCLLQLVVVALLPLIALGNRFCKENTDCEDLGKELECIKSACEWGICGCLRGYAARFTGSSSVFKCVPSKSMLNVQYSVQISYWLPRVTMVGKLPRTSSG